MNKTRQRENIMSYFTTYPHYHPSADEIYMYVKEKDNSIGIATVYRNLKKMVEQGVIAELNVEKQGVRYDLLTHEHYHFICDICGKIENFDCATLDTINEEVENITHGKVKAKNLTFHGVCDECLQKH